MDDVTPTFEGEPEALSVARTAELLGLPESEVRRRIAAGEFPVVAVGMRLMVMAPALQRWAVSTGKLHRETSERASLGHPLGAPAPGTAPAADVLPPCPTCQAPLVAVAQYVSTRFGRVGMCPHSPDYYAVDLKRPLRVYDLVPNTRQAGG
jgi:hypothetical protein